METKITGIRVFPIYERDDSNKMYRVLLTAQVEGERPPAVAEVFITRGIGHEELNLALARILLDGAFAYEKKLKDKAQCLCLCSCTEKDSQ